eukprot:TRINITY_DN21413_c0_g1_i3.p1 TRINITY_DN21413_c0_g1~~TRINITY_DN21413_c0_g1_i3.p1  ORF type:complete len:102 (-),score=17.52 TRINITY_DN21413_c0_g1_i3:11-316(-)
MVQSRGIIKAPCKHVLTILQDGRKKSAWDKMYKTGRNVEDLDTYSKVVYVECHGVWPTTARDFVALAVIKPEEDGGFVFNAEIGRAVQQECRDRSRMPSSA